MPTYDKLKEDMVASLRSGNEERVGVLRMMLAEFQNKEKEKGRGSKALGEEEAVAILKKEVKKRKEAVELFRKGTREDLAKKEEAELKIIGEYLPPEIDRNEVKVVVDRLFSGGNKEFNTLMRETMKELKGRAGGKIVSEVVKEKLS